MPTELLFAISLKFLKFLIFFGLKEKVTYASFTNLNIKPFSPCIIGAVVCLPFRLIVKKKNFD